MINIIKENVVLKWYLLALLEQIEENIKECKDDRTLKKYLLSLKQFITDALVYSVEDVALISKNTTKGILNDLLNNVGDTDDK